MDPSTSSTPLPKMTTQDQLDLVAFLREFREAETANLYTAAVIIADVEAKKVLAVWPMMPVREWTRPRGGPDGSTAWQWDWLWRGVKLDYDEMARRAGVARNTAEHKFDMLKSARLVYPDGTISRPAKLVLEAYVQDNLPKPPAARGSARSNLVKK